MSALPFSQDKALHNEGVSTCSNSSNVVFLEHKNPTPKKGKHRVENLVSESEYIEDAKQLTSTALKEKYTLTYDTWKNMKTRCKTQGKILDPRFNDFRQFLTLMGPRQDSDFTLDRVDNGNPNYSPENCRWANKHTQNQNKGNNVYLNHNGEIHTVSVWAKKTKQKADTLYHRKANGWSDEETITGVRSRMSASDARPICLKKLPLQVLADVAATIYLDLRAVNYELGLGYEQWLAHEVPPSPELVERRDALTRVLRDYTYEISLQHRDFDVRLYAESYGSRNLRHGEGKLHKAYFSYLGEMFKLTGDSRFKEHMQHLQKKLCST